LGAFGDLRTRLLRTTFFILLIATSYPALAQDFSRATTLAVHGFYGGDGSSVQPVVYPVFAPQPIFKLLATAERIPSHNPPATQAMRRVSLAIGEARYELVFPLTPDPKAPLIFSAASESVPREVTFFRLPAKHVQELSDLLNLRL
jgi:hypothetical protein